MVNDIIKNILIKFKGDSKDFEKSLKDIQKAGQGVEKNLTNPQSLKTMMEFTKNLSKSGSEFSASFGKFSTQLKEINRTEMVRLAQNADKLKNQAEMLDRKIAKSKSELEKQALMKTSGNVVRRLHETASEYNTRAGMISDSEAAGSNKGNVLAGLAGMMGVPLTPLAMAAAVAKGVSMAVQGPMTSLSSGVNLTNMTRGMYQSGMSGDLSTAFYLANSPDAINKAKEASGYVGNLESWNPRAQWRFTKADLGARLETLFTDESVASARRRKLEEYQAEPLSEALQSGKTMDLKSSVYLPYLQQKATSRLSFQRYMNLGDTAFRAMNAEANGEGLTEGEFTQTAGGLRSSYGSRNAAQMAMVAGRLRNSLNMDLGTSSGMLGAMSGMGATVQESEAKIATIMASAFSKGLKDYGLAENIAKANIEANAKTGNLEAANYGAARSAQILEAMGNPTDARSLSAAGNFSSTTAGIMVASPRNQTVTMTNLFSLAEKLKVSENDKGAFVNYLMSNPEALASPSTDPFLSTIINVSAKNADEASRESLKKNIRDIAGNPKTIKDLRKAYVTADLSVKEADAAWAVLNPSKTPNSQMPTAVDMTKTIPYALSTGNQLDTERQMDFGSSISFKEAQSAKEKSLQLLQAGTSVSAAGDQLVQAMERFISVVKSASGNPANSR